MLQHDMTDDEYARVLPVITLATNLHQKLHAQLIERGVEPIDAAIGAIYATHDVAMRAGMSSHDAIEWMRSATDMMERQLLGRDASRAH